MEGRQRGHVVGVARDGAARPPPHGDVEAGDGGQALWEQALLDAAREAHLLVRLLGRDARRDALGHAVRRFERPDGERGEGRNEAEHGRVWRPAADARADEHDASRHVARAERDREREAGVGERPRPERDRPVGVGERGGHLGERSDARPRHGHEAPVGSAQEGVDALHEKLAHQRVAEPREDGARLQVAAEGLRQFQKRPQFLLARRERVAGRGGGKVRHPAKLPVWRVHPGPSRWTTSACVAFPPSTVSRTHVFTWWKPCIPAAPGLT